MDYKQSEELQLKLAKLNNLIANFKKELVSDDLRTKVISLIPVFHQLREIGKAIVPPQSASSARDRILFYFKKYPNTIIHGDELLVVSGIQEYARRIRELRVQFGWHIINGITANTMSTEDEFLLTSIDVTKMGPDDYLLLSTKEDKEAAYRWNIANEIRKESFGVREKILHFFQRNIGKPISGEELR